MPRAQRKTAPKVRDGRAVRKNRWALTPHYRQTRTARTVLDRCRPPRGFRHYLTLADLRRFLELLPDWEALSANLDAVALGGDGTAHGWYDWDGGPDGGGIAAVGPWERDPRVRWDAAFAADHAAVLDRLDVPRTPAADGTGEVLCGFTPPTVRGFQLMHVLLHELGHHADRMATRSKLDCARGEAYAEAWAVRRAEGLWDDYFRHVHR